jgi:hypothetical protein
LTRRTSETCLSSETWDGQCCRMWRRRFWYSCLESPIRRLISSCTWRHCQLHSTLLCCKTLTPLGRAQRNFLRAFLTTGTANPKFADDRISMALFGDLGAKCALSQCQQHDFLPFTCEACRSTFCLEHRTRESHNCVAATKEPSVFICDVCKKPCRFVADETNAESLAKHKRDGCSGSPTVITCPVNV